MGGCVGGGVGAGVGSGVGALDVVFDVFAVVVAPLSIFRNWSVSSEPSQSRRSAAKSEQNVRRKFSAEPLTQMSTDFVIKSMFSCLSSSCNGTIGQHAVIIRRETIWSPGRQA